MFFSSLVPLSVNISSNSECSSSGIYDAFRVCWKQESFFNCPTFNDTKDCEDVLKFAKNLDTCGEKYGDIFLIDEHFWHPESL